MQAICKKMSLFGLFFYRWRWTEKFYKGLLLLDYDRLVHCCVSPQSVSQSPNTRSQSRYFQFCPCELSSAPGSLARLQTGGRTPS